ncbi:MAG: S1 RNA-binding domain-containing protein [Ruminococcaceae bacterium]|nr:S1 RNA-binding domain-containing protein [Oscillospiraceae bacterium]
MLLEVGDIVKGKVTGITKFGVFVELENGKTGMVHISEVAATYVREIKDYVQIGQEVSVKILTVGDDGKIGLSMKKAAEQTSEASKPAEPAPSFDEILSNFMKSSNEKMSSLKKHTGERRVSRRGNR